VHGIKKFIIFDGDLEDDWLHFISNAFSRGSFFTEAGEFVHCSDVQFIFETTHLNNAKPSMLGMYVQTYFVNWRY
jgi:hypothetical protein